MSEAVQAVLSKSEFARAINVTPGRVSQMIAEGKIGPEALEGEGRRAKIRVEVAKRLIAERTDIGQRFGNGIGTLLGPANTDVPHEPPAQREATPREASDPVAEAIKAERLRALQLANARAAEDRLAERGRYVRADQTKAAMTKMAAAILTVFEGGLADLASAIAAEHGLPHRDVLHRLRTEFREVRAKAAEAFRRDLANLPELLSDTTPDATDEALGRA